MGLLFNSALRRYALEFEKWIKVQSPSDPFEEQYLSGLRLFVIRFYSRQPFFGEISDGPDKCGYLDARAIFLDAMSSKRIPETPFEGLVALTSFKRVSLLDHDAPSSMRFQYSAQLRKITNAVAEKVLNTHEIPISLRDQIYSAYTNPLLEDQITEYAKSYEQKVLDWAESTRRSGHHSQFAIEYLDGVIIAARTFLDAAPRGSETATDSSEPETPRELARRLMIIDIQQAHAAQQVELNLGRQYLLMDAMEQAWIEGH